MEGRDHPDETGGKGPPGLVFGVGSTMDGFGIKWGPQENAYQAEPIHWLLCAHAPFL